MPQLLSGQFPFDLIFATLGGDTFSPRIDIVIGKAALSAGAKIQSSKMAALSKSVVEVNAGSVVCFIVNGRRIPPGQAV